MSRLGAGHSTLDGDGAQSSAYRVPTQKGEVRGAGIVSLLLGAGRLVTPPLRVIIPYREHVVHSPHAHEGTTLPVAVLFVSEKEAGRPLTYLDARPSAVSIVAFAIFSTHKLYQIKH